MCAQTLAANGCKVYITSRDLSKLKNAAENHGGESVTGEIIPVQMDQTDKESIKKCVAEISSKESRIDLLINNAGTASTKVEVETGDKSVDEFSKTLFDAPMEDWDNTYRTNVFALYYVAAAFLPLLVKANKPDEMHKNAKNWNPAVINISSISGITKTTQHGQFAYNSSKSATIQLNRLLATEFSRETVCVRVNSIAPGYFPSNMTGGDMNEENKTEVKQEGWRSEKRVPADRSGRDEDMAMAVIMLAKNTYVNGQTLVVDGGLLIEMP